MEWSTHVELLRRKCYIPRQITAVKIQWWSEFEVLKIRSTSFYETKTMLDFIRLLLLSLCGHIPLHLVPFLYVQWRKCVMNRFCRLLRCPKARHVKYVREWGQKSQMAFYIFTYLTCRYYRPNEVASILLIMVTALDEKWH